MSEAVAHKDDEGKAAGRASRRRWLGVGMLALAALLGFDLGRAPSRQWTAALLLGAIDGYQATVSPLLPRTGMRCRFTPTCSHYGEGAIRARGALVGSGLAAWRVLRCGPWTPYGTNDPPPSLDS
ncbi:MAG TPA: membrane protein insertion efficiency factor YidD [Thermoanaerobaculia bacterium]|nr:membrane protein insertion efficiency factor YidD [Thermoanaerobaculia bacterium]